MKSQICALLALAVIPACVLTASARTEGDVTPDKQSLTAAERLESLGWLQGHWKGTLMGSRYETVYSSPDAGMIVGASKEIQGGLARGFDFERMYVKDGHVVMTPYPRGKESVTFKLVDHDPMSRKAIFSNPDHDFPRKLTYEIRAEDNLVIVLEGDGGGQPLVLTLDLNRATQKSTK